MFSQRFLLVAIFIGAVGLCAASPTERELDDDFQELQLREADDMTPEERDMTPEERDMTPEERDMTPEERDMILEERDMTPEERRYHYHYYHRYHNRKPYVRITSSYLKREVDDYLQDLHVREAALTLAERGWWKSFKNSIRKHVNRLTSAVGKNLYSHKQRHMDHALGLAARDLHEREAGMTPEERTWYQGLKRRLRRYGTYYFHLRPHGKYYIHLTGSFLKRDLDNYLPDTEEREEDMTPE